MQVQVNCGDGLKASDSLERWVTDHLEDSLERFSDQLTRVEVQLTDEAKGKVNSQDTRCMLEGRITGHPPIAVNHHAENMDEALRGATKKLINALSHTLGKLDRDKPRGHETIRKDPEVIEQIIQEAGGDVR